MNWLLAGAALLGLAALSKGKVMALMRKPVDILNAVADVDPQYNPVLQPGQINGQPSPGATWCGKAIMLILAKLGLGIPWGEYGTLINTIIEWLDAGNDGWFPAINAADAQAQALAGKVVLATYYNPGGHGHAAIVLPIAGPMQIAQAGKTNFNQGSLAKGFGNIQPIFYVHD